MTALATIADLSERLGRELNDSEATRAPALLADASAMVRLYTGRQWQSGDVTARYRVMGGRVILPSVATAVTSVTDINGQDVPFQWDGLEVVALWPAYTRDAWEWNLTSRTIPPQVVDIEWTADPTAVPDIVIAVVCQVAGRALGRPADETGVQQESVAGYSYSVGSAAAQGPLGLLNEEKASLDRLSRNFGTAWLGPR